MAVQSKDGKHSQSLYPLTLSLFIFNFQDLFLVKPLGILALLDEESLFPKVCNQCLFLRMSLKSSDTNKLIRS